MHSVPMMYDTKTALILRNDLERWQIANVSGFLMSGLTGQYPHLPGEPYRDADGQLYAPLAREPIFVLGGDGTELARTRARALSRNMLFAIYTRELFATPNDVANRAAVAACRGEGLDLVGIGLHGERKQVDKVINGLKFLA